jgi:hypothetical protein
MIYIKKINFIALLISYFIFSHNLLANQSTHKIEVLVNDNIITNYDISQHLTINSILENTNVTSENIDYLYNKTVNDLVDMKLKQAKIEAYDIKIEEENSTYYEDYFFQSKGLDKDKIFQIIRDNGIDFNILKERINTFIAWERLTRGLFLRTISISESEVKELLKSDDSLSPELARRILTNKQVQLKSDKYLRDLRSEANIEER